MRCDSWNRHELCSRGVKTIHKAKQVRRHAAAIAGLCKLENRARLGMNHDKIERTSLLTVHPGQLGVVIRGSSNAKPTNQTEASSLRHLPSLAVAIAVIGGVSAKIGETALES